MSTNPLQPPDDDGGHKRQDVEGVYEIAANQLLLVTKSPLQPSSTDHVITLLAPGTPESALTDGRIELRGTQGVRVTAGPPMGEVLATDSKSVQGVEIIVGEEQKVTIQRGLLPVDQKIEMSPGKIEIDAGLGQISIKSLTGIEISVADGVSKISLTPTGVTIQGIFVRIN